MRLLSHLLVINSCMVGLAAAEKAPRPALTPSSSSSLPPRLVTKKKLRSGVNIQPLLVRGGAGPFDPAVAAKIAAVGGLAQGFLSTHAPTSALSRKLYDMGEPPTKLVVSLTRTLGTAILSMGVVGFCLFFRKADVNTAVGWYGVLWATAHLAELLNDEDKKAGGSSAFRYFWLPVATLTSYACFTNADYAGALIKAAGALTIISCLPMVVDPNAAGAMYGYKKGEASPGALAMVRGAGFWLVASGVLLLALAMNVEPVKAFGYACGVGALQLFFFLFVTKEVESLGIPRAPMLFWLLFHAVNVAAMVG